MLLPEIPLAQSIIQLFQHHDIQDIVISPGSRNAPLTLGFTQQDFFNCFSIVDERCAAFFAMGMAQQKQKPIVLVCTSGSAVLNYYPAVAETFYSQIPLIILSADRPAHKIDIGDGQTIQQKNVLKKHTLYSTHLSLSANKGNDKKIQKAIRKCIIKKGPVHINVPFEEPLYNEVEKYTYTPYFSTKKITPTKKQIPLDKWIEKWHDKDKKIVVIGTQKPNILSKETIDNLAKDPSVLVIKEATSNLNHENFISSIDPFIDSFSEEEKKDFKPAIVLSIGGMIVSKKWKTLLRSYAHSIIEHWHVDPLRAYDTYGFLTQHIETTPELFFEKLYQQKPVENSSNNYALPFIKKHTKQKNHYVDYFSSIPFSDLKVFYKLSQLFPKNIQLQISNSSAIRYAMLFDLPQSIEIFANRGTSGIDGSTSTAIGAAIQNSKPTLLITGDISFFYDSNALWNKYIPNNFKIIILNNGGGGIFRILPGHKSSDVFDNYFETKHQLSAEKIAEMYDFNYQKVDTEECFEDSFQAFIEQNSKPSILEIFTPSDVNSRILKNYFEYMRTF